MYDKIHYKLKKKKRPVHQLYHGNSLYDITHTLCMTSCSVWMTSHEFFMTSHTYMYDITLDIFMTSYTIYMISHILLSWQNNDCTWHLTYYIWYHSHCICVITQMTHTSLLMCRCINDITTSMEVITLGIRMISFTLYMTSHSHFMSSMLSIYDITTTVYCIGDISSPIPVTWQPLYL